MVSLVTARNKFLDQARVRLEADPRIVAAWLAGSFGRQEQDEFSDLDLCLVVADMDATTLCATSRPAGAGTVAERQEIVGSFGEPAIIHEHHANAPIGGSFTCVIYRESGLAVDWTFIPLASASREPRTLLLFDDVGVPLAPLPRLDAAGQTGRLAERYAFVWMLSVPAAKALRRGDGVRFHAILEMMHSASREIEHLLDGAAAKYTRQSQAPFCPTVEHQRQALLDLADRMVELSKRVEAAGATVPREPKDVLDPWLGAEI